MGNAREESALNMFRQMDLKGKVKDDTQLKTTHQNTINTIRAYEESGGNIRKFSSKFTSLVSVLNFADIAQPAELMVESWSGLLDSP